MKFFIFTYDRYDSITTSEFFKDVPHTVLCHTEQQKAEFLKHGRIHTPDFIATGKERGLAYNRNVALDMMDKGEWAVFFVDDLIDITYLDGYETETATSFDITPKNAKEFKTRLDKKCTPQDFMNAVQRNIQYAESLGLALVGFSLTPNPMFRRNRYSHWALADGRCWVVKKTHLRFDENVQLIDDTCWTAKNLEFFGGVVVDNWVLPLCKRYTKGAFGSIEERMPQKLRECAYLVEKYPGQIAFADKAGWPKGSHVRIRPKMGKRG